MKTPLVERPSWLSVYHEDDLTHSGGHWAGLTIYDEDSSWYCFRAGGPDIKEEHYNSIKFVNEEKTMQPLNVVKAAMMMLVFAEEEENL